MGDASEGERLLEGQWEQPSASWLALKVPAGQAKTQRIYKSYGGMASRYPSLKIKMKVLSSLSKTKLNYLLTPSEHLRWRKPCLIFQVSKHLDKGPSQ